MSSNVICSRYKDPFYSTIPAKHKKPNINVVNSIKYTQRARAASTSTKDTNSQGPST